MNHSDPLSQTDESSHNPLMESMQSDGYDCPLCLEHLYRPHTTSCGHIFCGRCITVLQKMNSKCPFRCPFDELRPAPLPQVSKMLEKNDNKIAKIIYREDQVIHLQDKVEKLTQMLLEQDRKNREMIEVMKHQQKPTCCIARLLYELFPPPPLPDYP